MLIAKASCAVLVAYLVARELVPRDLLSATFVAMFCVSPTVYTGVRRGFAQLGASILGGLATLAVTIPLGPGPAALALSIVLGLTVAWSLGFGATFHVAGFTVLYVSLIGRGEVDAYLVRLASVLLGATTATAVNLLFSAAFYRRIFGRRVGLALRATLPAVSRLAAAAQPLDSTRLREADAALGPVFRIIAELRGEFGDLRRELRFRRRLWPGARLRTVLHQERFIDGLELLCHHARDLALLLGELALEPGGAEDAAAVGVGPALGEVRDALVASAARLRGEEVALPSGLRTRYDPMLRRIAARIAEGDPESLRLELVLGVLADVENLRGTADRLLDLVEDSSPALALRPGSG